MIFRGILTNLRAVLARSCGIRSLYVVPDWRNGVRTPSTRTMFLPPVFGLPETVYETTNKKWRNLCSLWKGSNFLLKNVMSIGDLNLIERSHSQLIECKYFFCKLNMNFPIELSSPPHRKTCMLMLSYEIWLHTIHVFMICSNVYFKMSFMFLKY